MNPRGSAANLAQAFKDLAVEWEATRTDWRDVKAREFAETYIDVLPQQIARATGVIEEIDVLLRKVRHDCE